MAAASAEICFLFMVFCSVFCVWFEYGLLTFIEGFSCDCDYNFSAEPDTRAGLSVPKATRIVRP